MWLFTDKSVDYEEISIGQEPEANHGSAGEPYAFGDVVYTPEGSTPTSPRGQNVSYTIFRQSGVDGVIGVLFVAPNGAVGFIPRASSGDIGQDWAQQWAIRARDARIRYDAQELVWDAQSWFDYWIEQSGMAVRHEGPYESSYEQLAERYSAS